LHLAARPVPVESNPAILLEAGSIINRDEELKMDSPERRDIISSGVTAAVKEFCDPRWGILGAL
jgi:N-acetylmuramoyl-L-alanine amidase